jgi:activator of 2-hydroxyglutaryl-CoA dehydratase
MANILRLDIDDLGRIANESNNPAPVSSTCTVFAESEVISQLAGGVYRPDLVAGICQSVATRVASLARRAGVTPRVCMSGGVARNESVRRYMAEALGVEIAYDPLAQHFGAIGAAFYGWRQANQSYFGNF